MVVGPLRIKAVLNAKGGPTGPSKVDLIKYPVSICTEVLYCFA